MTYERLIPTKNCEGCELKEICDMGYISAPSYSLTTCEALKTAIREYGGKDKLKQDIFNQIKEFI